MREVTLTIQTHSGTFTPVARLVEDFGEDTQHTIGSYAGKTKQEAKQKARNSAKQQHLSIIHFVDEDLSQY